MTKGSAVAEANRLVAFINTLHRPDGDDLLADERASAWLADWLGLGIPERVALVDQGSLAGLRTLREGLRQLAAANNGQNPDGRTVLDAATVLQSKPLVVELGDDQQGPRLVAQADADADAAGPGIAAAAGYYFAVRAANAWPRVKACAAPDCRWAYLDTSRNRSRRWCDMADCGNRAKNQTWRQRQRVAEDRLASSAWADVDRSSSASE